MLALLAAVCIGAILQPAHAQQSKLVAAFEKDVKDSGLEYRKIPSPDVVGYFVSVKRPTMGSIDIPIALVDSTVAIQARVARKSEL